MASLRSEVADLVSTQAWPETLGAYSYESFRNSEAPDMDHMKMLLSGNMRARVEAFSSGGFDLGHSPGRFSSFMHGSCEEYRRRTMI